MLARRTALVTVLVALLVFGGVVPALGVSAVPKSTEMRLRGVSFPGTNAGWAVGQGILATKDGGKTWSRQFAPFEDLYAIDMWSPTQGCAVGAKGVIVRTLDGGASWSKCISGTTSYLLDVDFVDDTYGWAVGYRSNVLRTTDGGQTWLRCTIPIASGCEGRRIHGVSFVDRLHGWACGEVLFDGCYVIKTSDGGVTWTRCNNGLSSGDRFHPWEHSGIDFVTATTGWVTGDGPGLHKTVTGGSNWFLQSAGGLSELDFWDTTYGVGVSAESGTARYTSNGGSTWTTGNLSLSNPDPTLKLYPAEVCMSSSKQAWTVAQSWAPEGEPDVPDRGLIAHSIDGGAHWHTQASSTGPVFFLGGQTRYDTAINIAKLTDAPAGTVVLATGRDYPDALAASGLAGVMDATLLLTNNTLPSAVSKAIADLGASKVIIVGGADVVSNSIRDALAKKYTVERIEGVNRYETAANIARRMVAEGASADEVFIACGTDYADAASIASLSFSQQIPILLVKPDALPYPTKKALGDLDSLDAYVVGGTAAVGNPVVRAVESAMTSASADAVRVADGVNRYSTSVKLAGWADAKGWIDFSRVGIATGRNFPDALTGGALMGSRGQTVLLTDPTRLSGAPDAYIAGKPVDEAWIMNDRGTGAVQDPVGTRLAYLLR